MFMGVKFLQAASSFSNIIGYARIVASIGAFHNIVGKAVIHGTVKPNGKEGKYQSLDLPKLRLAPKNTKSKDRSHCYV